MERLAAGPIRCLSPWVNPLPLLLAFIWLGLNAVVALGAGATASQWPQFRGPGGGGVAPDDARPPVFFGPSSNVLWRIALPPGNSSPIFWNDRLFVTAFDHGHLATLALDAMSGRELWRQDVTPERVEEVHQSLGSPASATAVTDGERVWVHFGSVGVLAYDFSGHELWRRPMQLTQTEYGASSSPILAGENVVQLLDQDGGSHLIALNQKTGAVAWRVERPEMRRGFGTPLIWDHDGASDLVVPGTLWLEGLDPRSGAERWRVSGLARITCTSPVVGDGLLFTASWTTGGDRTADRISMPKFEEVLAERDKDHDGKLNYAELPDGPVKQRFKHLDGNRDSVVDRSEWESMAAIFSRVENQAFAVKPDARGGLSDAGVLWRFKKGLPYVASPVYYRGRFYTVKNGGMFTCLEPQTGRPLYQEERLGAVGDYYASLTAADGRIYIMSQRGLVTVVKAGDAFQILAQNDLGEPVHASPAIVGGTLFLRTAGHLYAFR